MNFRVILDVLFPPECLACAKGLHTGTLCGACARSIGDAPAITIENVGDGPACYFLAAAGRYENRVLRSLIHALKFEGIRDAAEPLAGILAHRIKTVPLRLHAFTVVPMPLARPRERERGFNQSHLIAARLAGMIGLPFNDQVLLRTRHRKPQSATPRRADRIKNIRGCFAAENQGTPVPRHIILVDDVSTSGATFRESARTLIAAGTKHVLALAVAKA